MGTGGLLISRPPTTGYPGAPTRPYRSEMGGQAAASSSGCLTGVPEGDGEAGGPAGPRFCCLHCRWVYENAPFLNTPHLCYPYLSCLFSRIVNKLTNPIITVLGHQPLDEFHITMSLLRLGESKSSGEMEELGLKSLPYLIISDYQTKSPDATDVYWYTTL